MPSQFVTYFRQFRLGTALRLIAAHVARRVLDRHGTPTYAQFGEDRIISYFVGAGPGLYVDVGCNDPCQGSNTFELYKRGWRGLTIDANERMVDKHARVRTRDTSICAAVSGDNAIATFTEFDDPFVSSLNPAHVAEWAKSRRIIRERAVQTRTLTEILKANSVPQSFEVLSVDVEGHDFEVLSSLDLSTYRPRLIVIEMHGFDVLTAEENAIYRLLSRAGYALVSFVVMNGYFIDTRAVNGSGK